tara:strand:- start:59 stop:544 length:486 start_codon:yes stop_codon:yes gene_type:complete
MIKELTLVSLLTVAPDPQAYCLALNVYHEARNQAFAGQLAVANVVINRVNDERFPNNVCDVVTQGPTRPSWKGTGELIPVRNRCQFSWYCDGKSDTPLEKNHFNTIYSFSYKMLNSNVSIDITNGATHYHADYVNPSWSSSKTRTVEIEDHIFYRWEYNND